jgi:thioredoxin reductase
MTGEANDEGSADAAGFVGRTAQRTMQEVIVVGGGNSAGQAAVFLASSCRHVHLLVRSKGLADSMSDYLIRRITDTPTVTLHANTEISSLEGQDQLERVVWRRRRAAAVVRDEPARNLRGRRRALRQRQTGGSGSR